MNSKKRCAHCKKYFPFDSGIQRGTQFFCTKEHLIEYASKNVKSLAVKGVKAKASAAKKAKADHYRQDVRWQHSKTQSVFNKMRVLEELLWFRIRGMEPTCISCGKPLGGDQWCCGHFKTVGAQGRLRYNRINTYLQHNHHCNKHLSGDIAGTKNTHGYLAGLKIRFGYEQGQQIIDHCEENQSPYKWTWQEVEQIRKDCNKRIRELQKELEQYEP